MNIIEEAQELVGGPEDERQYLRSWGYEVEDISCVFGDVPLPRNLPGSRYVNNHPDLVESILQRIHHSSVGITSPPGSGKTALAGALDRKLESTPGFTSMRIGESNSYDYSRSGAAELISGVSTSLSEAGYEFPADTREQLLNAIRANAHNPVNVNHKQVESSLATQSQPSKNQTAVVIVDGVERYSDAQLEAIQALERAGIQFVLLGIEQSKEIIRNSGLPLHAKIDWIDRSINRFDRGHTAEYISRVLSYADSRQYQGPEYRDSSSGIKTGQYSDFSQFINAADTGPFTAEAITALTGYSDGLPRSIHQVCRSSLCKAVREWYTSDLRATEVPVTPDHIDSGD